MRVLLCAIAKLENDYLREWVEYHKNLGFDNIILYDNNDIDGEHFEEVIDDYIKEGYVIVKDKRGVELAQVPSYMECYEEFSDEYEWIAFWDIDEFLELETCTDIHDFLNKDVFKDKKWIRINWKQYTDSDIVYADGNYSVKRFTEVFDETFCRKNNLPLEHAKNSNTQCKSIVRAGLEKFVINSPHVWMRDIPAVNALGVSCSNEGIFIGKKPIWKEAWLNHYRFKTIEEYAKKKMVRLWPTTYGDGGKKMLNIEYFFKFNKRTPEKEELIKRIVEDRLYTRISTFCYMDEKNNALPNNWGDELNFNFLQTVMNKKFIKSNEGKNYIFIGSVLNDRFVNEESVIWGAGIKNVNEKLTHKPQKVYAVRGPLTRDFLISNGIDCPEIYGDPALLLPRYYTPDVEKQYKLGIIPHWESVNLKIIKNFKQEGVKIINLHEYDKWTDIIDDINSCEYIASESLHGLIVAEAYNVPNLWIKIKLENQDIKFHDFFLSMGKDRKSSYEVTEETTVDDLLKGAKKYKKAPGLDLEPLIKACPFDLDFTGKFWIEQQKKEESENITDKSKQEPLKMYKNTAYKKEKASRGYWYFQ